MIERAEASADTPQATGGACSELRPHHMAVLQLLVQGRRNQEIADALGYSVHTVENYMTHILTATRCRSRAELIARLLRA